MRKSIWRDKAIKAPGEKPLNRTDSEAEIQEYMDWEGTISALEAVPEAEVMIRADYNLPEPGVPVVVITKDGDYDFAYLCEPDDEDCGWWEPMDSDDYYYELSDVVSWVPCSVFSHLSQFDLFKKK